MYATAIRNWCTKLDNQNRYIPVVTENHNVIITVFKCLHLVYRMRWSEDMNSLIWNLTNASRLRCLFCPAENFRCVKCTKNCVNSQLHKIMFNKNIQGHEITDEKDNGKYQV